MLKDLLKVAAWLAVTCAGKVYINKKMEEYVDKKVKEQIEKERKEI